MERNALIIYSSRFAYTKKISEVIAEHLHKANIKVDIVSLEQATREQLSNYQGIIIGASVRYGHYVPLLHKFCAQNADILHAKQACFFSVSIVASKPNRDSLEKHVYTRKFFAKSPWQAKICAIFAGELDYQKYNLFEKLLMKFVMKINGRKTSFGERIEFTDWQKVHDFADEFIAITNSLPIPTKGE